MSTFNENNLKMTSLIQGLCVNFIFLSPVFSIQVSGHFIQTNPKVSAGELRLLLM